MGSDRSMIRSLRSYIFTLDAREFFESLGEREKLYAFHMARATWSGARIIMRQVSPESVPIYDFILETHRACDGDWEVLRSHVGLSERSLNSYLDYAAVFLANVGNYYGRGDQKFIPPMPAEDMGKIALISERARQQYERIREPMFAIPPYNLGFSSDTAQSSYYPGAMPIDRMDIDRVTTVMKNLGMRPDNTRLEKRQVNDGRISYDILLASVEKDNQPKCLPCDDDSFTVNLVRGDHSEELEKICDCLAKAREHAASTRQEEMITKLIESFRTGDMQTYKEAQKLWIKDKKPPVETVLGFIEPYRDPYGMRGEFEAMVGVVDVKETELLSKLTARSTEFIGSLPWTQGYEENRGLGPFEKELFEPPEFTSLQVFGYCASILFFGQNLPNFNDLRQSYGFKNLLITNRQKSIPVLPGSALVDEGELAQFQAHCLPTWHIQVIIHELFGHGTSKLLMEESPGQFNFDIKNPPLNPLTGKPVDSWYKSGETWNSVFGDIATAVEECRAECVGAYLLPEKELLALFGFTDDSDIAADDLIYNLYLTLGVKGLTALKNYNIQSQKWGQAHDRARFAMFRTLLAAGGDFMTVKHDVAAGKLLVRIDRTKILSHGRSAIGDLVLKLVIYRCTADLNRCRALFEGLTLVDGVFNTYRDVIMKRGGLVDILVQPNTFLTDNGVVLREYEPTAKGMIRSWAERENSLLDLTDVTP